MAAPHLIWSVGQKDIPAFEDALMAVRATNFVRPAFEAGELPPRLGPMADLTGNSRKPTPAELTQVMQMQHVAKCLEHMFFYSHRLIFGKSMWTGLVHPSDPDHIVGADFGQDKAERARLLLSWKESFRRATYRLFLTAAALAHAYHEPFFRSFEQGAGYFAEPATRESMKKDEAYLGKFAVFNYEHLADKDAEVFEPVSSWIVEAARTEGSRRNFIPFWKRPAYLAQMSEEEEEEEDDIEATTGPLTDLDIFPLWELMRMWTAHELAQIRLKSGTDTDSPSTEFLDALDSSRKRKTSVVLFGTFQLTELTMPARIEDTEHMLILATPVKPPGTEDHKGSADPTHHGHPSNGPPRPFSWDVSDRLRRIPLPSDRSDGDPGPGLGCKFFSHIIKTQWGRKFTNMDVEWANAPVHEYIAGAEAFAEGDDGREAYGLRFLEQF
ncbi:hypothetical protein ACHAQH_004661 [Verticillium albo-atrum]